MPPATIEARIANALQQLKSGRLDAAERLVRELIEQQPREPRAHALLARVLNLSGRPQAARAEVDAALALDPGCLPALMEDAQLARAAGDHAGAAAALGRLTVAQPANAALAYDLAVSLLQLEQNDEAEASLWRALALAPELLDARFKLAHLAARRGDYEAARQGYQRCCEARPAWPEAWLNLGLVLLALGRASDAAAAYAQALALAPDSVEALHGYARALHESGGDPDRIIAATQRATEIEPDSAAAWCRLALSYRLADRGEQAASALARALELDPDCLPARWDRFQLPDSIVRGGPEQDEAFLRRWIEGLEYFEGLDTSRPEIKAQLASVRGLETNFHLHYLGRPFVELQTRYARMVERLARAQYEPAPRAWTAAADGRLRVGFVSGQFRRHSVTRVFRSLIEGLPRERFELSLFHCDNRVDAVTSAMQARAEHYLGGMRGAREWAEALVARPLDALVFVDIGMHPIPQFLMSYRFAPLQCALWGHPVTTGSRHIDWFISADAMEPPEAERNYSERLLRLPGLGTCYPYPEVAPDGGFEFLARREAGTIHYLLAQNLAKLTPVHDELLARIAQALPAARFSLTPNWHADARAQLACRMRKCFELHGLDFDRRVHIHPWLSEAQFLGLAARSDVNLDSLGFSGGVTTLEITRFDVPTVTLPGQVMRARQSYGMLKLMGLDELIAQDPDDYVRIAVRLGREPEYRAAVRARIAAHKHVLYDDRGVIKAFVEWLDHELARGRRHDGTAQSTPPVPASSSPRTNEP